MGEEKEVEFWSEPSLTKNPLCGDCENYLRNNIWPYNQFKEDIEMSDSIWGPIADYYRCDHTGKPHAGEEFQKSLREMDW